MGFSVPSILSNDSRAELRGVTISIPQLYNFVKTLDNTFFENKDGEKILALISLDRKKEKAEELYKDIGLQLPSLDTILCFDNSIAYSKCQIS